MIPRKRPILVTGAHRSGSTWIGRIISSSSKVRYIHEPFNIENKRNYSPIKYWFEYISNNTENAYQQEVLNYINSFYSLRLKWLIKELFKTGSPRSVYHYLVDVADRIMKRTLLKDPIALMSAEWIHQKTNCDVIIALRHPAAFVASLKVKNWTFEFDHFLQQKDLMQTYLEAYVTEIEDYSKNEYPIVEQAILLWNIIYSVVAGYQEKYGDKWHFVKHEDLSVDPIAEYRKLFDGLKLKFDDSIKEKIERTTTADIASEHERDSKENRFTWKQRLTPSEIELIKEKTFPVWTRFYTDKDWD